MESSNTNRLFIYRIGWVSPKTNNSRVIFLKASNLQQAKAVATSIVNHQRFTITADYEEGTGHGEN